MDTATKSDEATRFRHLQRQLPEMFARVFPDRLHPRCVLVIPSLSLDAEVLSNEELSLIINEQDVVLSA